MAQKAKQSVVPLVLFLTAMTGGAGYLVYRSSPWVIGIGFALACAACFWTGVSNRRERRRLGTLAGAREGESLCHFARSFDKRRVDTWIVRAVHEELQLLLRPFAGFPVRASDSLSGDLGLDGDDVEDLIADVARRAGRSLAQAERNPFYGQVRTVSDVVLFVNAQAPVQEV